MLCFIACFIRGNSKNHERLNELSQKYSPNELIRINGKNWIFIRHQSNENCWMYSYEKCAGKFITTFGIFHLNEMGDFIQLSFADGDHKIETAHDHAPEIRGNYVDAKLRNGKHIDVYLSQNSLFYDNYCSITQIK